MLWLRPVRVGAVRQACQDDEESTLVRVDSTRRPATLVLALPSPVVEIRDDRLDRAGVRLLLKRDDLIHPELPGNKWRKLKYNLTEAAAHDQHTLLTFGGAYSNHIRATAAAGHYFGLDTVGVIRGEEHLPLNSSLAYAVARGMRVTYLDRGTYRRQDDPGVIAALRDAWGPFYLLPEGGSNALAVRGCAELPGEIEDPFDVICCPVGTGGTLAGIAAGLAPGQRAIGFAALRGGQFLADKVAWLARGDRANWHIEYDFHFGGYARTTDALVAFAADLTTRHGVRLDHVYNAKMMFGIFTLVESHTFAPGTTIVAVITG
jgi:1-aminocyclopropane-1-carboxylate deaminase